MSFKQYRKEKYKKLLDDVDLKRWYRNLGKGSIILADVYLRALGRFCEHIRMTPKQFVKLSLKKMEDVTHDFIDELESAKKPSGDQKYSPGYMQSYLKAIRSWAEWNRKPFRRKIKIRNASKRPTLKDERAPTQEELKKVLYNDKTSLRTRASIALISFSGLRIEVLGDYLGLDGLRIKDLPDLEVKDGTVTFSKVPAMISVREELSKSRHRYLTFLCEEGCNILKQYLERRMSDGESLRADSGITTTSIAQARKSSHFKIVDQSPFLRTTKIGDEIRKAMRAAGLPWRPYVFRTFFDTVLMLGESKGFVSHTYQQFWMGHKGDIEAQYTTHKNRLPDNVIDDMREAYLRIQDYLQTSKPEVTSEEKIKRAFKEQLMMVAGFKKDEIESMDLSGISDGELQSLIRQRLLGVMENNGSRQKVIQMGDVESYIGQGWEYVAALPNERAILKLPI